MFFSRQPFSIPVEHHVAFGSDLGYMFHLGHSDSCLNVGHSIVETNPVVPVRTGGIHAVVTQFSCAFRHLGLICDDHPTLDRGNYLVAIETEAPGISETSGQLTVD